MRAGFPARGAQQVLQVQGSLDLRIGSGEVDAALDGSARNHGVDIEFASRPDDAQRPIRQEVAAHVVAGRLATRGRNRVRLVERHQLRLLPRLEYPAVDAPWVYVGVRAVVDADAKLL